MTVAPLAATLPERYFVQTGERSYVVLAGTDTKEEKPFSPDVGVASASREGGVAVAEPAESTICLTATWIASMVSSKGTSELTN